MKKFAFALAIVATLVAALITTGYVSAQGSTPTATPPAAGYGYGRGMGASGAAGAGILHDGMITVYAQKLGISVDDLNARLAFLWQIMANSLQKNCLESSRRPPSHWFHLGETDQGIKNNLARVA